MSSRCDAAFAGNPGAISATADHPGRRPVDDSQAPPSDRELFRALCDASPAQRTAIEDLLVRRHTGLVRRIAGRYANPSLDVDELLQVGYLALVLAIRRFDLERGCEFTTFARPTVQGEIRRYFRDKRRWIRLPRGLQEAKATLRASSEVLTHRMGHAPSAVELAEHSGLPLELVLEALGADDTFNLASLDAALCDDHGVSFTIADTLGDFDARIELVIDCDSVRPLLANLPERERRILHMRFYENRSQSQIGAELGYSQMHVCRLLARTLETLRSQLAL